jgi:hypothetical protein
MGKSTLCNRAMYIGRVSLMGKEGGLGLRLQMSFTDKLPKLGTVQARLLRLFKYLMSPVG